MFDRIERLIGKENLALIKNKLLSNKPLNNSEEIFFGSAGKLRKNYLKFFEKIEFHQKTKILS